MSKYEAAVIEAAKLWKKNPKRHEALLRKAIENLEEQTCTAEAIGGDPAWPYMLRCVHPAGHDGRHKDSVRGEWSAR